MSRRTGLVILCGMAAAARAAAQDKEPSLVIPRVSHGPKLEDYLNRAARRSEVRVTGFRQREPGDGAPVSMETAAYLSYDDRNIYVVFVCKDDPVKVRAHMSKREDLADDDRVSVYLDTFRDSYNAYIFTANPLGIQSDAIHTEGRNPDGRFDTLWHTDAKLTGDGYVVLFAIPFKSLRFPAGAPQTWGVALSRGITRNNERAFWPYVTRRRNNFMRQMATLDGLRDISPGRNIQITPYGTFSAARLLDAGTAAFAGQREARAGMDSKVILRDSLTLDATLNPDFSQVESDDPQVTVNQRFEVRFPEKRPFFIENASYFETPISLFFSRRIADPEYGMRLTGKLGRWSVGGLAIDDRAPGRRVSPSDPMFGRRAVFGVGRVQRDIGKESRIGALATAYDFGSASNRVVSLDGRFRLSPTWFFNGQSAHSFDQGRVGPARRGSATTADLTHASRNFTYTGSYLDISPNFRTQSGFVRRVDMRQTTQYVGYYLWPENSRVQSMGPSMSAGANWDHKGVLQDWFGNADFTVDFKGPLGFKVGRYEALERYLNRGFRYGRNTATFYIGNLTWLYIYGSFSNGAGVNYVPAGDLQPFLGRLSDGSFGFTLRPLARMRLEQFYYYSRLATPESSVYVNHLFRTKFNYQFTRALSGRFIADYYSLLPNTAQIAQEKSKLLTGDVLFTYLLNPGTALYFGYTNRRQNIAVGGDPPVLQYGGAPLRFSGHQVFVKVSYLFRF